MEFHKRMEPLKNEDFTVSGFANSRTSNLASNSLNVIICVERDENLRIKVQSQ